MKKALFLILFCLLITFTSSQALAVIYGRGDYETQGYNEATAWEINSAATLAKYRDDVNSGKLNFEHYCKLTKDIDLTGYPKWTSIGNNTEPMFYYYAYSAGGGFMGHFNGNGHTIKVNISKLLTTKKDKHLHGLFGFIRGGGSIKNLVISGNIEIISRLEYEKLFVGGIASYLVEGSIENCKFDGNITVVNQNEHSFEAYAGGIVAYAGCSYPIFSIKNCKVGSKSSTSVSVSKRILPSFAGGIVGYLDDGEFKGQSCEVIDNYVKATVRGNYYGGLYGKRGRGEGIILGNIEEEPDDDNTL